MRLLLPLIALFLSGCATRSIVISPPPVDPELLKACSEPLAAPLTTADQYDLARALVEAVRSGKQCQIRHRALADAVRVREEVAESVKQQVQGKK
jgi:hypothetical protein